MKGMFGMSVSLLLLCVLWGDSQPVHTAAHTVREMIELLRAMTPVNEQMGQDTELMDSPEVLWPNTEDLEKRDLPRLGVAIHRALPSRVHSSMSVDASRYRLSSPAKWMSSLQG
ncbi:hypothetical protein G5714_022531 [Onychostoma macrolepis]|uniref:Uncharacterized protein n=1 Tax=Onychostoma macrolepis TaxID=369639 RepID=A0A7J6BSC2_9TELE|nr:hypothetical protein G5714_022531 [Onychostoma macrolepis]